MLISKNKTLIIYSHLGIRFSAYIHFLDNKGKHMMGLFFNCIIYFLDFFSSI